MLPLITLAPVPEEPTHSGCSWWDLLCQGGQQVADSGLAAITSSMSNGLVALFGQVTKIVDESTRVPLADETYRDTYYGFATLAVPVIAVVFLAALLSSALHRDMRALTRAVVGTGVAGIGGAVYVVFAQFLIALDDWLAHGVVSATGSDFGAQMGELTGKFEQMGSGGSIAANALMLILMCITLIAGVFLWIVLLLRKMAILVVVAFAPLLIVGWMWAPTRSWSRKATEVLVALVFAKTVIYMIFGIGMSMLIRGDQSLSDFVGVIVLLCGACFAPLVMLKLVHFAADSHLAGEMVGTLRAGAQPAMARLGGGTSNLAQRQHMAKDYASSARTGTATVSAGGPRPGGTPVGASGAAGSGAGAGTSAGTAGAAASGGAASGLAGAASGGVGLAVVAGTKAAGAAVKTPAGVAHTLGQQAQSATEASDGRSPSAPGPTHDSSDGGSS